MQITVTITDELAVRVEAAGCTLEAYVKELLEERPPRKQIIAQQRREAVDAMLRFAEEHKFRLSGDDLKSMVHEGHKH